MACCWWAFSHSNRQVFKGRLKLRKTAFIILLIFISGILFADVYEELENSNKIIEELVAELEARDNQITDLQKTIDDNTKLLERNKKTIENQNKIIQKDIELLKKNSEALKEKDKTIEKLNNKIHNYRFSLGGGITYPVGGNLFLSYKPFESLPLGIYMTNYLMRYDDELIYAPGIGVQIYIK